MAQFRFQNLDIWKESIELSNSLFDISDMVEKAHKYRFAEQLRGAVMSISNNISEGSGSFSNRDFANFLNMSRRSIFEVVNILTIFERRGFIQKDEFEIYVNRLDVLSRKVTNFRKSLLAKHQALNS